MRPLPLCAHLGYLFTELPLEDRFAAAARAGFDFIEHPAPYPLAPSHFRALCTDNGLTPAQIALPMGGAGGKGLAALPGREDEFARTLSEAIAYAVAIGCRLIHPMAGVTPAGTQSAAAAATYRSNLALACSEAAAADLTVIVEPVGAGTLAGYYVDHPAKALAAIAEIGAPNLRLSFDAFHAQGAGVDPAAFARENGSIMAHVQIADAPGRHEPGTGLIDFAAFFAALGDGGYQGVVGLEYIPARGTVDGLSWTSRIPGVRPLIASEEYRA